MMCVLGRAAGLTVALSICLWGCAPPGELRSDWVFSGDLDAIERDLDAQLLASPREGELHLKMAALHRQRGRTGEARAHLAQILDREPAHVDALHLLGLVALDEERPREAAQHLLAAAETGPKGEAQVKSVLLRALRRGVDAALAVGEGAEVVSLAEHLESRFGAQLEDRDRLRDTYAARAEVLFSGGYYRETIEALDAAERFGASPAVLFRRAAAMAQLKEGDSEAVFARYVEALEPEARGRAWAEVGDYYASIFAFDEAVAAYDRASQQSGQLEKLQWAWAQVYLKMRRPELADAKFAAHLASVPESERETAALDVARELVRFQERDRAIRVLQQAMLDSPSSLAPATALARLHASAGKTAEAETVLRGWVHSQSGADRVSLAARAAQELGLAGLALDLHRQRLEGPSPDAEAWLDIARVEESQRNDAGRDSALDAYVQLRGREPEARERAGLLCAAAGRIECAERWLAPLLAEFPGRFEATVALAEVMAAAGRGKEAAALAVAHLAAVPECESLVPLAERLSKVVDADTRGGWFLRASKCAGAEVAAAGHHGLAALALAARPPRTDEAEAAIRAYVRTAPNKAEARSKAVELLRVRQGFEALRAELLAALAEEPDAPADAHRLAAEALLEAGRAPKAVEAAVRYLKLADDVPAATAAMVALFSRPEARGSLPRLLAAVDVETLEEPRLHYELGLFFALSEEDRDYRRAHEHFNRYLLTTKDNASLLRAAADFWLDQGFADLAVRALGRAMLSGRDTSTTAERLGAGWLALGDVDLADRAFTTAMESAPSEAAMARTVAGHWIRHAQPNRAAKLLASLAESGPRSEREDAFSAWIAALASAADNAAIVRAAEVFAANTGPSPKALELISQSLLDYGLLNEAETYTRQLLDQAGESVSALVRLTRVLAAQGRADEAVSAARRAASQRGFAERIVMDLAPLLLGLGAWDGLVGLLDEAIQRGQGSAPVLGRKALALLLKGDPQSAHAAAVIALTKANGPEVVAQVIIPEFRAALRMDLALDLAQRAAAAAPTERAPRLAVVDLQLATGAFGAAQASTRALVDSDPSAAGVLAPLWAGHAQYDEALRLLMAGLDSAEGLDREGLMLLQRLLSATGRMAELEPAVERFLAKARESDESLLDAIIAYLNANAIDAAVVRYEQLARVLPGAESAYRVGALLLSAGRTEAALRSFRRAVDELGASGGPLGLRQQNVGSVSDALGALSRAGMHADVASLATSALGHAPSEWALFEHWLRAEVAQGRVEQAARRLVAAWERGRFRAASEVSSAVLIIYAAGLGPELHSLVRSALDTAERPSEALLFARLLLAAQAGEVAQIGPCFDAWLRHVPRGRRSDLLPAGAALMLHGAPQNAISVVAPLADPAGGPLSARAVELLARAHVAAGAPGRAREVLRRWAQSYPQRAEALRTLEWAAGDLQLWDVAESALVELVSLLPPGPAPDVNQVLGHRSRNTSEQRSFVQSKPAAWSLLVRLRWFEGRVDDALDAALALARSCDDRVAGHRLAVDLLNQSFAESIALRVANEWFALAPGSVEALRWQVLLALASGDIETATQRGEHLFKVAGPSFVGADILAANWLEVRDLNGIQRWLSDPTLPPWLRARYEARIGVEQGNTAATLDAVDRLVGEHPAESAWALDELATDALSSFDCPPELAAELAARALAVRPDALASGAVRALARLGAGDVAPALAWLETAAGYFTGGYLPELATEALSRGEYALAEEALRRLSQHSESWGKGWESAFDVVRSYAGKRKLQPGPAADQVRTLGLKYVGPAVAARPESSWYATLHADLLEHTGDSAGAERAYRALLTALPGDSTVRNNLAYLLARRGDGLEEARQLVRQAQRLDPAHNVYYLDTEGWVEFHAGRFAEAEKLVSASVRMMTREQGSNVAEGFWHWGQTLQALGRKAAAMSAYRRAILLDPRGEYGEYARRDLAALRKAAEK